LLSPAQAIERTRSLINLKGEGGAAHFVRRLDADQSAYYLVVFTTHLVCIDAYSGELLSSAATGSSPLRVSADQARQLAGRADARAELVWAPSAASLSMLDPVWSISTTSGAQYVDQRGRLWDSLPMKRPGG
jgi:hypothetical protein